MPKSNLLTLSGAALLGAILAIGARYLLLLKKKAPLRVLITGAAGQIGYALAAQVATGNMLGLDQPVILHLLELEPARASLEGVRMELVDGAFPLLQGVFTFTDAAAACRGVDVAVMVGGYPRRVGEERRDLVAKNVAVYRGQAAALAENASRDVKVVVVATPANTNALVLAENAPSIPRGNITCLTRLDHNRALGQIAERAGVHVSAVKNVIVWGNQSSRQYSDVNHGSVAGKPIRSVIADDAWLDSGFIATVQQRGAEIIKARGLSAALSAANAVCGHVRDWLYGTPPGSWTSMGVVSGGEYGVEPGLVFSYPVTCRGGKWRVVQGLPIDPASRERLLASEEDLKLERDLARQSLAEAH